MSQILIENDSEQLTQTFFNKFQSYIIFIALLFLSVVIYGDFLFLYPKYWHTWAQTDRFCLALRYVENGLNFFKPQVCNLGKNDGTTGVEFPLLFYVSAIFMRFFSPESPFFVRFFSLLSSLIGLTHLYKVFIMKNVKPVLAIFGVSVVFSSTIFLYYQANFNANHFAFGFAMTGIYYVLKYISSNSIRYLYLFYAASLIGSLCKTPNAIYIIAPTIYLVYFNINDRKKVIKFIILFLSCFVVLFSYYKYNQFLNMKYDVNFFTNNLENYDDLSQAIWTTGPTLQVWFKDLLGVVGYLVLILIPIYVGIKEGISLKREVFIFGILIFSGSISIYYLMGKQYLVHDYYFIDIFYIPVGLILVVLLRKIQSYFHSLKILGAFSVVLTMLTLNMGTIRFKQRLHLNLNDRCDLITRDFEDGYKILDSLGISRNEKLMVFDAFATNEILYYLKRKGYTNPFLNPKDIDKWKSEGIRYIIAEQISVETLPLRLEEGRMKMDIIFNNGKFRIYKIK